MCLEKNWGFTVIELVISVAILSILLLITIPDMNFFLRNNRSQATVNTIFSALQFTRSEAINHKIKIKYCKSSDHKICGGNWEDGQIIIDRNEKILRVFAALNYHDTLILNSSLGKDEFIEFATDGGTSGQVGTFTYTPNGQKKYARTIVINHAGRVSVGKI
jgi:type IV fimbrial biogenesis protein FimT